MYCPEHILINNKYFMLTMYGSGDIPKRYVPVTWWANPLRYEVIIRIPKWVKINREGLWRVKFSNFIHTIKKAIAKITRRNA